VATVESIAIVTGEEPLKLTPLSPVPMVKVLEVAPVTVIDPPRLTAEPLMVIEELVSDALAIFDSVLVLPLIDLFVKVSVVSRPTSVVVDVGSVIVPVLDMALMTGDVSVLLVSVSDPASVASVPDVGSVTFVAPVAVNVTLKAPAKASVEPSANVNVAAEAGAVNATLLMLVAVAAPRTGVTNVGVLAKTNAPDPVSSEITPASCEDVVEEN
jgi:hypothetical protein